MVAKSLLAAGLLAAGANAAIVISNPVTGQTWYKNDTISLNWTASAEDPQKFRIIMSNPNTALLPTNPQELANEVPTANDWVGITIGYVQPGSDFTVQFVNTTNTSQVFAEVKEIKVEEGIPSTKTSALPSSTSGTTSTTQNVIPNVQNTPTGGASSTNPFTTPSAKPNGAASSAPAVAAAGVFAVVAAALAL